MLRYSSTPTLRSPGFEDEDDDEDENEAPTRAAVAYRSRIPPTPGIDVV